MVKESHVGASKKCSIHKLGGGYMGVCAIVTITRCIHKLMCTILPILAYFI